MRKHFLTFILLGAAVSAFGQISVGVTIGRPPAPRVIRNRPRVPGPEYIWVDGYWFANGRKWKWHDGYWTRPPFAGAHWVTPRYEGGRFFEGFWDGDRGRFEHDHRWDRDRDRDFRDRDRH